MSGHRSGAKRPKAAPPQQPAADTEADKRPGRGRKSEYTPAMATAVCEMIATGHSLRQIGDTPGMPCKDTVLKWLGQQPDFAVQYARARELQAEALGHELLEIVDDPDADPLKARLRYDARKWLMSKLAAKKYGDRSALDVEVKHSLADMLVQLNQRRQSGDDEPRLIGEGTGDDG